MTTWNWREFAARLEEAPIGTVEMQVVFVLSRHSCKPEKELVWQLGQISQAVADIALALHQI